MTSILGPGSGQPRPSMNDVAMRAGVSLGTVSNVLNRPERVAEATRHKVQLAMSELGYVPNAVARSLVLGSARTLGLIVGDLTNALFVDIVRGAEQGAEENGLTLMLANSDARMEREAAYLLAFAEARATGILITLNDTAHFEAVSRLAPAGIPLVVVNYRAPVTRFCSVTVDNELGGYMATRHLIDSGRRRLVFVGGPGDVPPLAERARGFRRAVAERPGVTSSQMHADSINRTDGWQVGAGLRTRAAARDIDGIVAATDLLAAGLIQALSSDTVAIPHDIAVVGYGNNQAAWDSPIPISSIAPPGADVGRQGADLVRKEALALDDGGHRHEARVLAPRLIVRQSSS